MHFDVRHNIASARKALDDAANKQIPFATSVAINEVLTDVKKNADKWLAKAVDRPTPFTLRAWAVRRSSKRNLSGAVFAKDTQAEYLKYLETSGTRQPKGKAILIPWQVRLNKYGNLPKGRTAKDMARPDTFASKHGGKLPAGIYRRSGKGKDKSIKMIAAFEKDATYTKAPLRFGERAHKTAAALFPARWFAALSRALR